MLSLVWKDLVAARRYLLLVIPLGGVQLAVLASVPPIYPIAALTFSAFLAFGSLALDESQRTELLWNSLPITRSEFVSARYLVALIGMTIGLAFGWAVARLATQPVSLGIFRTATLTNFSTHAFMFGLLVLAAAVFLPLHFRFGPGKAVLLFLAVAVAVSIIISLLAQLYLMAKGYPSPISDPDGWRNAGGAEVLGRAVEWTAARLGRLLAMFVAISSFFLGLSWSVSRRLYETRDL